MTTPEQFDFDVFLAHNSADKPQIMAIAKQLEERNLRTWLDEDQILGGRLFQDEIQQAIPRCKTAAIFIGLTGLGRWQGLELRTFISQFVDINIPVIPVLLPGVEEIPDNLNLKFLRQFNKVRFEDINDSSALDKLERAIRGDKPNKIIDKQSGSSTSQTLLPKPRTNMQQEMLRLKIETLKKEAETITGQWKSSISDEQRERLWSALEWKLAQIAEEEKKL